MLQRITTKDALNIFLLNCQAKGLSGNSTKFYRGKIGHFIDSQQLTDEQLTSVTVTHIRQYLRDLQVKGLSAHSCQSHAKALRVFFNFSIEEGYLDTSPMAKVPLPKARRKKPLVLTDEEIKIVLKACDCLRDRLIVLLSLDTGLRAMELCNLNFDNVVDGKVFVLKGKGSKDRVTFIGSKTKLLLAKYYIEREKPGINTAILVSQRTDRLTISGLVQFYKKLRIKTGIEKLTSHTIRRTALTLMLKSGMSIYHLKEIAGHEDIKTLQHYINVDDDLENAHAKYGVVDHL